MTVIGSVTLRFVHDFVYVTILTVTMGLHIRSGKLLGVEEGANFVHVDTEGWAKDQHRHKAQIYDFFDLRVPQVETGALFVATNIQKSPIQVRYRNDQVQPADCVGSTRTEKCGCESCGRDLQCTHPQYTEHGFMGPETQCDDISGYCRVTGWCNLYKWQCRTTGKVYGENAKCDAQCPKCFKQFLVTDKGVPDCLRYQLHKDARGPDGPEFICEIDGDGNRQRCYNRERTLMYHEHNARCNEEFLHTNASLNEDNVFTMDGVQDWMIKFDIFMRFSKYWQDRQIVDQYYEDVNGWTVDSILAQEDVETNYEAIKESGIMIVANGNVECTLLSTNCNVEWKFKRVDKNGEGFAMTNMIYTPGVSVIAQKSSSREIRHIYRMRGIRIVATISSKLYAPDPMAAVIAIGGIMGLLGLSNRITNFIVERLDRKNKQYRAFMEVDYATFVQQEKGQIKEAFDVAIAKHMKALYAEEQAMKDMLGIVDGASDKEDRF